MITDRNADHQQKRSERNQQATKAEALLPGSDIEIFEVAGLLENQSAILKPVIPYGLG